MKKFFFGTTLAVVATAVLIVPALAQRTYKVEALKGKPMPTFSMTTLDGKTINNQSLRNRVTVIDFWATWCGPCRAASPKLDAMHKEFSDKGLQVIAANVWERGRDGKPQTDGSNARAYIKEHGYSYTVTINNDKLAEQIQVEGVPTFLIVDRQGRVAEVMVGFNESRLRQAVQRLLD